MGASLQPLAAASKKKKAKHVTAIFYITTTFAWEEVKLGTKTLSIDMLDWMATMRRLVLRRPIFGTLTDITDICGFLFTFYPFL